MIGEKRWPNTSAWHNDSPSRYFLPIPTAVATGDNREHQWAASPVSAKRHRLVGLYSARTEYHRPSGEYSTQKMSRLGHALGGFYATASSFTCCTWNLKPPCYSQAFGFPAARPPVSQIAPGQGPLLTGISAFYDGSFVQGTGF